MMIYVEIVPEHYVHQASITIHCKESEKIRFLLLLQTRLAQRKKNNVSKG